MAEQRVWSAEQNEIFAWFAEGKGNLVVRARAGTGKTTTLIEGIRRCKSGPILLAAFNKTIAQELQSRLHGHSIAEAKTLHSLGFGFLRNKVADVRVDETERKFDLTDRAIAEDCAGRGLGDKLEVPRDARTCVTQLHTKLREILPHCEDVSATMALAIEMDIYPEDATIDTGWTMERIARVALRAKALAKHAQAGMAIDFADMIFLPLVNGWVRPRYALVCIDEAQDMNGPQLELAMLVCRPSGRIAVIGDDRQAIYGFRGADSNAIDRLKDALSARELPLCTTYRCGKRIVDQARRFVPDFTCPETAHDGKIIETLEAALPVLAQHGDFVISRTNAPLAALALALFRGGKRVRIRGRDLGKALSSLVRRLGGHSVGDLSAKLNLWMDRQTKRCAADGDRGEARLAKLRDQYDFLRSVIDDEAVDPTDSVEDLCRRIEALFTDDTDAHTVMLSTVHKAKGLEADRVFLYEPSFFQGGGTEADNLRYVAITRAKYELHFVGQRPELRWAR